MPYEYLQPDQQQKSVCSGKRSYSLFLFKFNFFPLEADIFYIYTQLQKM